MLHMRAEPLSKPSCSSSEPTIPSLSMAHETKPKQMEIITQASLTCLSRMDSHPCHKAQSTVI